MPHEYKPHIVALFECVSNVVNGISGNSEDVANSVGGKNFEDKVGNAHSSTP